MLSFRSLLLAVVAVLTVTAPGDIRAANFCAEEVDNAVILQVARTGIGRGIDRVYPVELRPARVKEPTRDEKDEADAYKVFNFWKRLDAFGNPLAPEPTYRFESDGRGEQVLYKQFQGRKRQRVTLYKVEFPRSRLTEIKQFVRANDRTLYETLKLDDRLEVLGVMGVIFRGGRGTVDFVNRLEVSQPNSMLGLIVRNADAVLYRYALMQQLEGVSGLVEPGQLGQDNAFASVLRQKDEGTLLTGRLPGGTTFYETIVSGKSKPIDHWWSMNQSMFDFPAAPGKPDLTAADFSLRYASCVPMGDAQLQAKAVFVPVKVLSEPPAKPPPEPFAGPATTAASAAPAASAGKYPIIVYPGAFADLDTLRMALERAYAQGAWWNAVLNLPQDSTEREFLLRLSAPQWLWQAIRSSKRPASGGAERGVEKIMDENAMGQGLMQTTLDRLRLTLATPIPRPATSAPATGLAAAPAAEAPSRTPATPDTVVIELPGVPHPGLIQSATTETPILAAEMAYNQAVHILKYGATPTLDPGELKALRKALIQAIAHGYTLTKEQRNTELNRSLNAVQQVLKKEILSSMPMGLDKLVYTKHDLEWLHSWVVSNKVRLGVVAVEPLIAALEILKTAPGEGKYLKWKENPDEKANYSLPDAYLANRLAAITLMLDKRTDITAIQRNQLNGQVAETRQIIGGNDAVKSIRSLQALEKNVNPTIYTQNSYHPDFETRVIIENPSRVNAAVVALEVFIDGPTHGNYDALIDRLAAIGLKVTSTVTP